MAKTTSSLRDISPSKISTNPENPRLIFHESEMRGLFESIRKVGIKVPISVYEDRRKYVLIDGERRWRCACKLNLKTIPALLQPKPNRLENLLMMFNIHNVRVQWDLLPMAYKLQDIKKMLEKSGKSAGPRDLAGITGLSVPIVNQAFDLLNLPKKYQKLLFEEVKKPRDQQKVKVNLFIEIKNALRAVERNTPDVFDKVSPAKFLDVMFFKYTHGIENNVVNFRNISKIVRAKKTGKTKVDVVPIIIKLVKNPKYSIQDAYDDSVKAAYELSDLSNKVSKLADTLSKYRTKKGLSKSLRLSLRRLAKEIARLLRDRK
jgi:ParB family chromosome partitioning protein